MCVWGDIKSSGDPAKNWSLLSSSYDPSHNFVEMPYPKGKKAMELYSLLHSMTFTLKALTSQVIDNYARSF